LLAYFNRREKSGGTSDEAIATLALYFNSSSDKVVSDETKAKTGARRLHVVADDEESTKYSRVHAIVVDDDRKRVDVVFRGTAKGSDWWRNLNAVSKVSIEMDRRLYDDEKLYSLPFLSCIFVPK
jgi:hypothetical protein